MFVYMLLLASVPPTPPQTQIFDAIIDVSALPLMLGTHLSSPLARQAALHGAKTGCSPLQRLATPRAARRARALAGHLRGGGGGARLGGVRFGGRGGLVLLCWPIRVGKNTSDIIIEL